LTRDKKNIDYNKFTVGVTDTQYLNFSAKYCNTPVRRNINKQKNMKRRIEHKLTTNLTKRIKSSTIDDHLQQLPNDIIQHQILVHFTYRDLITIFSRLNKYWFNLIFNEEMWSNRPFHIVFDCAIHSDLNHVLLHRCCFSWIVLHYFHGQVLMKYSNSICNTMLRKVELGSCRLTVSSLIVFLNKCCNTLEELTMHSITIVGDDETTSESTFSKMSVLKKLTLKLIWLKGNSIFINFLQQCVALETFHYVYDNELGVGKGGRVLPTNLEKEFYSNLLQCSTLKDVYLQRIDSFKFIHGFTDLYPINLQKLVIHYQHSLSLYLFTLKTLIPSIEYLHVEPLDESDVYGNPVTICNFQQLKHLDVSLNILLFLLKNNAFNDSKQLETFNLQHHDVTKYDLYTILSTPQFHSLKQLALVHEDIGYVLNVVNSSCCFQTVEELEIRTLDDEEPYSSTLTLIHDFPICKKLNITGLSKCKMIPVLERFPQLDTLCFVNCTHSCNNETVIQHLDMQLKELRIRNCQIQLLLHLLGAFKRIDRLYVGRFINKYYEYTKQVPKRLQWLDESRYKPCPIRTLHMTFSGYDSTILLLLLYPRDIQNISLNSINDEEVEDYQFNRVLKSIISKINTHSNTLNEAYNIITDIVKCSMSKLSIDQYRDEYPSYCIGFSKLHAN
jgi:hypothetical protein